MSDILSPDDLDEEAGLLRTEAQLRPLLRLWQDATPLDWGGFLLRPEADAYDRADVSQAPHSHGIYGLFLEDRLLYVGKANSLCQRLGNHYLNSRARRSFWFDSFSFCRVADYALRDVEVAHIQTLTPPMNKLYEPIDWPGHESMAEAVRSLWEPCLC